MLREVQNQVLSIMKAQNAHIVRSLLQERKIGGEAIDVWNTLHKERVAAKAAQDKQPSEMADDWWDGQDLIDEIVIGESGEKGSDVDFMDENSTSDNGLGEYGLGKLELARPDQQADVATFMLPIR